MGNKAKWFGTGISVAAFSLEKNTEGKFANSVSTVVNSLNHRLKQDKGCEMNAPRWRLQTATCWVSNHHCLVCCPHWICWNTRPPFVLSIIFISTFSSMFFKQVIIFQVWNTFYLLFCLVVAYLHHSGLICLIRPPSLQAARRLLFLVGLVRQYQDR